MQYRVSQSCLIQQNFYLAGYSGGGNSFAYVAPLWCLRDVWIRTQSAAQRWASTLANRSNARHRSNIRAPPRPLPPDICFQSMIICVARGAESDSKLARVLGCRIFVPAPHAPPPKGRGQRSKVIILPTTGAAVASWRATDLATPPAKS